MKRLLFSFLLLLPMSVHAGQNILIPMVGFSRWTDDSGHTARGSTISFEDENSLNFGAKYLYMFDAGFALGANAYLYEKDVLTTNASSAGVIHVHGLAEYFFNHTGTVSPFLGLGVGFSSIGFNDGILDEESSGGESFEFNAGVLFRTSDRIGFQIEYKYTDFDMDEEIDDLPTDIESESHSVHFGVSIHI